MKSKTGFTGPGMQTAGMMTAVANTGTKTDGPGMTTGIGAAKMISMIAGVFIQSVTLGPSMAESSAETAASCIVAIPKEREAETTTALRRATAAGRTHSAVPREARLTLSKPYLGIQG